MELIVPKKYAVITATLVVVSSVATYLLTSTFNIFILKEYNSLFSVGENTKFKQVNTLIKDRYYKDAAADTLSDGALHGMVDALNDPYSAYMNKEEADKFNTMLSGSYSGIGVTITGDEKDKRIVVVSPIEGTPAERAGLKFGDKILKVDGEDVWGDKTDDAVSKIKGEPGTSVSLEVLKEGAESPITLSIVREKITLKSVWHGSIDNIGYIRITSFDKETVSEFEKAIEAVKTQNATALILDLRNNPGGLLDVADEISDLLMPEGVITYMQYKNGEKEYINSDPEFYDVPISVLINGGSASASEIVAGALRDSKRGILIGTKTFGKGVVQQSFSLGDGSYVKLTVANYFTPNGENINKIGIEPDIIVEDRQDVDITQLDKDKDPVLKKAIETLSN